MKDAEILKHTRLLKQHAETIAVACRDVEKELSVSALLGVDPNRRAINKSILRIEKRFLEAAKLIGINPPAPTERKAVKFQAHAQPPFTQEA
jgi:hypothetical protein